MSERTSFAGMAENMARVEKSGVYRDKATGHAISLTEGKMVAADTLDRYTFDGKATAERTKRATGRPAPRLGGIIDAPPPIEQRRMPAPSNKMAGPDRTKSEADAKSETDAGLAPDGGDDTAVNPPRSAK